MNEDNLSKSMAENHHSWFINDPLNETLKTSDFFRRNKWLQMLRYSTIVIAFMCGALTGKRLLTESAEDALNGYWQSAPEVSSDWGQIINWWYFESSGKKITIVTRSGGEFDGAIIAYQESRFRVSEQGELLHFLPPYEEQVPVAASPVLMRRSGPVDIFVLLTPADPDVPFTFFKRIDSRQFPKSIR